MLFQFSLAALHIDVLLGRKLRADSIVRSGTTFEVLAAPKVLVTSGGVDSFMAT